MSKNTTTVDGNYAAAHILYESAKDIMYLCVKYCRKNYPFVKSMKN